MIKKCKITNIINAPIWGVTEQPIREGNEVELNCGQILACLGISNVDEILPSGTLVRLDKDNYLLDNSGNTEAITIKDEVVIPEVKEVKKEEPKKVEEPVEVKEEVKEEAAKEIKEETIEEIVGQDPIEEEEVKPAKNTNKKNKK